MPLSASLSLAVADIFCTQCGTKNKADANFCQACGSRISAGTVGGILIAPEDTKIDGIGVGDYAEILRIGKAYVCQVQAGRHDVAYTNHRGENVQEAVILRPALARALRIDGTGNLSSVLTTVGEAPSSLKVERLRPTANEATSNLAI